MGTRLAIGVNPGGVRAANERLPHPPADRRWLSPAAVRLLTDEELAAVFCRLVAMPAGKVPIVLNVDVPDRALTAAFQAAGAALAAIYLARGQATPRSIGPRSGRPWAKGVLIATGRTPYPYRGLAVPEGQGQVSLPQPPGPGPICGTLRSATSRASRSW